MLLKRSKVLLDFRLSLPLYTNWDTKFPLLPASFEFVTGRTSQARYSISVLMLKVAIKAEWYSVPEATVFGSSLETAHSYWGEAKTKTWSMWFQMWQSWGSQVLPCCDLALKFTQLRIGWSINQQKSKYFSMDCCSVGGYYSAAFFAEAGCFPATSCMTTEALANMWWKFYLRNILDSRCSKYKNVKSKIMPWQKCEAHLNIFGWCGCIKLIYLWDIS